LFEDFGSSDFALRKRSVAVNQQQHKAPLYYPPLPVKLGGAMLAYSRGYLFDAFALTGHGVHNGVGDTRFVLIATVSMAWLAKLPLGYALAHLGLGAVGAWWGIVFEILVLWALIAWRLRRWLKA
jgi:hypothetical protein